MGKLTKKPKINLGGQEIEFDLNLNAMINFEEKTGKSLLNMKPGDTFNLKEIRVLLWAGLNETKEITLEEVGKHINPSNMAEVSEKVTQAYEAITPDKKGTNKGKN